MQGFVQRLFETLSARFLYPCAYWHFIDPSRLTRQCFPLILKLILSLKILCQEAVNAISSLGWSMVTRWLGVEALPSKELSLILGRVNLAIIAMLRFSTMQPDTLSTSASSSAVPRVNSLRAPELMWTYYFNLSDVIFNILLSKMYFLWCKEWVDCEDLPAIHLCDRHTIIWLLWCEQTLPSVFFYTSAVKYLSNTLFNAIFLHSLWVFKSQ